MNPYWLSVTEGEQPLILSIPHTGTDIPDRIAEQLNCSKEQALIDTDWWVEKLYDFAVSMGVSVIRTDISRTVIDLNRDPSGQSLYPGKTTTTLCPIVRFDGKPLYQGKVSDDEICLRRDQYFTPYHAAIEQQIKRLKGQFGQVVIFDAHSIRSCCPQLFEGELPGLNIGTNSGLSCSLQLAELAEKVLRQTDFSVVSNGRFKGGWITRHYGEPEQGIHAIQLEIAQRCYLREPDDESRPRYSEDIAAPLKNALIQLFSQLIGWAKS